MDFGVGQRAKGSADIRSDLGQAATTASAKIDATLDSARQKGSWPRRSVVIPQQRDGDAPSSLLAIRPSASTRDPPQYFNSPLEFVCVWEAAQNGIVPGRLQISQSVAENRVQKRSRMHHIKVERH